MPVRSTPFKHAAVDDSGELTLPRVATAFWIIDRDLRITTAYGAGFDTLSLHPELDTIVGLDLFEYFKTDNPAFESIANHLRALGGESVDCESRLRGRVAEVRLEPLRMRGEVVGVIGLHSTSPSTACSGSSWSVRSRSTRWEPWPGASRTTSTTS